MDPVAISTPPINFEDYDLNNTICLLYPETFATRRAFRLPHNEQHIPRVVPAPRTKDHPSESSTQLLSSDSSYLEQGTRTPCYNSIASPDTPRLLSLRTDTTLLEGNNAQFFFGSNPSQCDFLLDHTNQHGVSGRHFRIYFDSDEQSSKILCIQNLSSNKIFLIFLPRQINQTLLKNDSFQLSPDVSSWTIKIPCFDTISFTLIFPPRVLGEGAQIFQNNIASFTNHPIVINENLDPIETKSGVGMSTEKETPLIKRDWDWKGMQRLKTGGQGVVSKIQDLVSRKYFAAKEFERYDEFVNELKYLEATNHTHIVDYIDVVCHEGRDMIIMEYLPNGNLFDRLYGPTPPSLAKAKSYWLHLSEALEYLHGQNILHRDIKPGNILFSSADIIKFCDFGLSKTLVDRKNTHTQLGTACYMGPERTRGEDYGTGDDVWAFGIVVLDMLGELPKNKPEWRIRYAREPRYKEIWTNWLDCVKRVVKDLEGKDLLMEHEYKVLQGMLKEDAGQRLSAKEVVRKLKGGSNVGIKRQKSPGDDLGEWLNKRRQEQ